MRVVYSHWCIFKEDTTQLYGLFSTAIHLINLSFEEKPWFKSPSVLQRRNIVTNQTAGKNNRISKWLTLIANVNVSLPEKMRCLRRLCELLGLHGQEQTLRM